MISYISSWSLKTNNFCHNSKQTRLKKLKMVCQIKDNTLKKSCTYEIPDKIKDKRDI